MQLGITACGIETFEFGILSRLHNEYIHPLQQGITACGIETHRFRQINYITVGLSCNRALPLAVLKQINSCNFSSAIKSSCNRALPLAVLKRMALSQGKPVIVKLQLGITACGIEIIKFP